MERQSVSQDRSGKDVVHAGLDGRNGRDSRTSGPLQSDRRGGGDGGGYLDGGSRFFRESKTFLFPLFSARRMVFVAGTFWSDVHNSSRRNVIGKTKMVRFCGNSDLGGAQRRGSSPDDVLQGAVLEDGVVSRSQHGRLAGSLEVWDPHNQLRARGLVGELSDRDLRAHHRGRGR